jgi:outer membrane protein assembly factor BamB
MLRVAAVAAVCAGFTGFRPLTANAAEPWSGWRGSDRSGWSRETELPQRWSADQGIRWKATLPGHGTSSPIIWESDVIVTAADGIKQSDLHIICLRNADGSERWHLRLWGTAPTLHHGSKSDMATPTPVTDGRRVFALFGTGDVLACDADGGLLWHRSLAAEYGPFENRFGHTSSPLLVDNLLIVQCDHYGDSYLLAIEAQTGRDCWRIERPGIWHSWSSPQLVGNPQTGETELVVCAAERIDGFRIATGEALWTARGLQRECIPTPVIGQGLLLAVSGPNGATFAIRPGGRGDVTDSHIVWQSRRGVPFVPSPVVVDDCYYLVNDQGIATCLDVQSGQMHWQSRLSGAFTASPIAGDGKIYFSNEDGETTVVKTGNEFVELSRNTLGEPVYVYASGAISQGCVYLRTPTGLVCIDGKARSNSEK